MPHSRSLAIFMEEEVFRGSHRPPEHWFSPLSNAFSYLHPCWIYARGISDVLIHLQKLQARGTTLHRLRIHSHGFDWGIRMGADDIRATDIQATDLAMNSELRQMLDLIRALMQTDSDAPSELRFDACGQVGNQILQSISKYLGDRIIVRGFSRTGNPMTKGDLAFLNGGPRNKPVTGPR